MSCSLLVCCCCLVTKSCPTLCDPHEPQHSRLPCPSLSPKVCSNSCPFSQSCHSTISSSVVPFSSCPQSFPASGSFPMSQVLISGGQSIGVSASTSVLPMNIQGWFPLGWTGLLSSLFTVWFQSTCFSLFLWLSIVMDPSAHNTPWAKLRFKPVMSCCRCEIEATLERLKKLERDLSFKEQELKERERRLKMWEQKLTEQSSTPVSAPCRARWPPPGRLAEHGSMAPPPLPPPHLPPRAVMGGPAFTLE